MKEDKKNIDAFEPWCWGRPLKIPLITKQKKWIMKQMNPVFSSELQITRHKLLCLEYSM